MRVLVLAVCVLSLVALAPAEAAPPGGGCHVQEEYVTEASLSGVREGNPSVEPGARRPVECYY